MFPGGEDKDGVKHVERIAGWRERKRIEFFTGSGSGLPKLVKEKYVKDSLLTDRYASLCGPRARKVKARMEKCDGLIDTAVSNLTLIRLRTVCGAILEDAVKWLLEKKVTPTLFINAALHFVLEDLDIFLSEEIIFHSLDLHHLLHHIHILQRLHWSKLTIQDKIEAFETVITTIGILLENDGIHPKVKEKIDAGIKNLKSVLQKYKDIEMFKNDKLPCEKETDDINKEFECFWNKLEINGCGKYFKKPFITKKMNFYLKEYVRESRLEDILIERGVGRRARRADLTVRVPVVIK